MVVRRLGVWSVARIYGVLSGAFGLIAGVIFALISSVSMFGVEMASPSSDAPAFFGPLLGLGAILFLPVLYGALGVVAGALSASLYNLFAGIVGGIELDIQ